MMRPTFDKPLFRIFKDAAADVRAGWAQYAWNDGDNKCLVQSVINATPYAFGLTDLPDAIVSEMDAALKEHRGYRVVRVFTPAENRLYLMAAWNDMPWRRKDTVIKTLESIGMRLEVDWLAVERIRLLKEVDRLTAELEATQARVYWLEQQNAGLVRRLVNKRQIASDNRALEDLSYELERTYAALNA